MHWGKCPHSGLLAIWHGSCKRPGIGRKGGRDEGSKTMIDTNLSLGEARRFLLAVGGGLLFSLACLATALGPANANCFCTAASVSLDRPALL
jgi:hypothetical protein